MKQHGIIPPVIKASPRFSEINPKVGQIMSLNNRLQFNAGVTRPSVNYALGSTFDPYLRTVAGSESNTDSVALSSKYVTAKKQYLEANFVPNRGRNAQSLTVEVRGKVRTSEENRRAKRQSMDAAQHMTVSLPETAPRVTMNHAE